MLSAASGSQAEQLRQSAEGPCRQQTQLFSRRATGQKFLPVPKPKLPRPNAAKSKCLPRGTLRGGHSWASILGAQRKSCYALVHYPEMLCQSTLCAVIGTHTLTGVRVKGSKQKALRPFHEPSCQCSCLNIWKPLISTAPLTEAAAQLSYGYTGQVCRTGVKPLQSMTSWNLEDITLQMSTRPTQSLWRKLGSRRENI